MLSFLLAVVAFVSQVAMADQTLATGKVEFKGAIEVENNGKVTAYDPSALNGQEFGLWNGSNFSVGATTRCDPFLGATVNDLELKAVVAKNGTQSFNKETGKMDFVASGPTGALLIKIAKGTSVFGRCQTNGVTLQALTFQSRKPFEFISLTN